MTNDFLNPCIAGAPVVEPCRFFGRQDVFDWIEQNLSGRFVNHILVIHGQRRDGKTSVLKQIPFMERLVKLYPRAAMGAEHLIKCGLLREQNGDSSCYAPLSSSLEGWITREMAAGPDEEASQLSVTEWLQSGRMTLDEPEKGLMAKVKKQYWPLLGTILREMSFELAGNITFELLLKALL